MNCGLWGEPLGMSTQPVLFPVLLATDTDPLMRAVAAYLARFKDATRVHTESDLRAFLLWCAERRLAPLNAQRVHVELYVGMNASGVLEPCEIGSNRPHQRIGISGQQDREQNRLSTHP